MRAALVVLSACLVLSACAAPLEPRDSGDLLASVAGVGSGALDLLLVSGSYHSRLADVPGSLRPVAIARTIPVAGPVPEHLADGGAQRYATVLVVTERAAVAARVAKNTDPVAWIGATAEPALLVADSPLVFAGEAPGYAVVVTRQAPGVLAVSYLLDGVPTAEPLRVGPEVQVLLPRRGAEDLTLAVVRARP